MENYGTWGDTDSPILGPYPITKTNLDKMLIKAYNITKEPRDYYPTVDSIDDLLESDPFLRSSWVREDTFKLFIMCLVWGFSRDKVWHAANPGYSKASAQNLLKYVMTPYAGDDSDSLHVNVWDENASEETKEDRQAAFEYMQSIVMDKSIYQIVDKSEKKSATCA